MDKTTLTKIEDALTDHKRTVSSKITNGKFTYEFQENVHQDFNNFVSMIERKLDAAELLNRSTQEYLYSEAPVTYSEIDKLVQSHGEQAISSFLHATSRTSEETLDAFQSENTTDEDKLDTFTSNNKRKNGIIQGQKQEDTQENNRITQNRIAPIIEDFVRQIQQVAVRTNPLPGIDERFNYFRNSTRQVVSEIVDQLKADFDRHTTDIYDFIEAEVQKFESTILKESGLGELEDKEQDTSTRPEHEEETVYTQELADLFKSGDVDTSKLSAGELSLYLNYLFDGPMPEIVQSTNRDAFHETKHESLVDTLPASIFDEPAANPPSLDIAPELQPLPPDVLQDYNKRVEEGRRGIEEKKKDENENKIDLDSLPEIFL